MSLGSHLKKKAAENWRKLKAVFYSNDSHHSLAMGFSVGIFFGCFPLVGFRILMAFFVAWLLKANTIAAAATCAMFEFFTPVLPLFFFWEHSLGCRIMAVRLHNHAGINPSPSLISPCFDRIISAGIELFVGGFLVGIAAAAISYLVFRAVLMKMKRGKEGA